MFDHKWSPPYLIFQIGWDPAHLHPDYIQKCWDPAYIPSGLSPDMLGSGLYSIRIISRYVGIWPIFHPDYLQICWDLALLHPDYFHICWDPAHLHPDYFVTDRYVEIQPPPSGLLNICWDPAHLHLDYLVKSLLGFNSLKSGFRSFGLVLHPPDCNPDCCGLKMSIRTVVDQHKLESSLPQSVLSLEWNLWNTIRIV